MTLMDAPTIWPPVIDHSSPVPYYAQVKETLRGRIERRLETGNEAHSFRVSRNCVRCSTSAAP